MKKALSAQERERRMAEDIWLNYFNRYLWECGTISETEYGKKKVPLLRFSFYKVIFLKSIIPQSRNNKPPRRAISGAVLLRWGRLRRGTVVNWLRKHNLIINR